MSYRWMFMILSLSFPVMSPIINWFVPLEKEVIFVTDLSQRVDLKKYYPVLGFLGMVRQHGYTAEKHVVTSSDGYILTLHRISGGPDNPKAPGKPVAYLQHGLLQASDSFVTIGPDTDLAYQLVKAGYDVWLGNCRGNAYSKSHVSKDPRKEDFWDFSFHEMAVHDVPAMIDYILTLTEQTNLTYYGFSMGTTISYIMLSMRPEYNDKVNLVYSLAPAAFWKHEIRKVVYAIRASINAYKEFFQYFKAHRLMPLTAMQAYVADKYCSDENIFVQPLCAFGVSQGFSVNFDYLNKTALPIILSHNPSGSSKYPVLHYNQNYETGKFQAYDYGSYKNFKKYGQRIAPVYNLTNVKAPVIVYYGMHDDLVNGMDALDLQKVLPNVISVNRVQRDSFNHLDFLWSTDVKHLVYDHIVKKL